MESPDHHSATTAALRRYGAAPRRRGTGFICLGRERCALVEPERPTQPAFRTATAQATAARLATELAIHRSGLRRRRLCRSPPGQHPIRIEVVGKSDNQVSFAIIARRWAEQPKVPRAKACGKAADGFERFSAWINRNRQPAKHFVMMFAYSVTIWMELVLPHSPMSRAARVLPQ